MYNKENTVPEDRIQNVRDEMTTTKTLKTG